MVALVVVVRWEQGEEFSSDPMQVYSSLRFLFQDAKLKGAMEAQAFPVVEVE
jgi:hypothetical protein